MTKIHSYSNISVSKICMVRKTSEGKEYTLNHSEDLVVDMRYKGIQKPNVNSQGWERNSVYYFKRLLSNHPEYFGKKNTDRIRSGESPKVDKIFIRNFPQYRGFENEILVHHHIGKNGQAVALPQSIHKGAGEIHIYENELGITENAKKISYLCETISSIEPSCIGKTEGELLRMAYKYFPDLEERKFFPLQEEDSESGTSDERNLVLKKEITSDVAKSRLQDTEETLRNYRENLMARGITDESKLNDFIAQERSKILTEYEQLDSGKIPSKLYQETQDWGLVSEKLQADGEIADVPQPEKEEKKNAFTAALGKTDYESEQGQENCISEVISKSNSNIETNDKEQGMNHDGGHSR